MVLCVESIPPKHMSILLPIFLPTPESFQCLFQSCVLPRWMKEFVFRQDNLFRRGVVEIYWRSEELFWGVHQLVLGVRMYI